MTIFPPAILSSWNLTLSCHILLRWSWTLLFRRNTPDLEEPRVTTRVSPIIAKEKLSTALWKLFLREENDTRRRQDPYRPHRSHLPWGLPLLKLVRLPLCIWLPWTEYYGDQDGKSAVQYDEGQERYHQRNVATEKKTPPGLGWRSPLQHVGFHLAKGDDAVTKYRLCVMKETGWAEMFCIQWTVVDVKQTERSKQQRRLIFTKASATKLVRSILLYFSNRAASNSSILQFFLWAWWWMRCCCFTRKTVIYITTYTVTRLRQARLFFLFEHLYRDTQYQS